jgi:hypothetical protein
MTLDPNLIPTVLALQPGEYLPLQDTLGPVLVNDGLAPHVFGYGAGVTLGIDTGTGKGLCAGFDGTAAAHLTTGFSVLLQPQGVFMFFRITDLTKQGQALFHIGSNNTGDGWGMSFNRSGNTKLEILRAGIAFTDTGLTITDTNWHSLHIGVTPTNQFGMALDGVYGYQNTLTYNSPSAHIYVAWDGWLGGNNHAKAQICHFGYFYGTGMPGTPETNTILQAAAGLASQSVPATPANVAVVSGLVSAVQTQLTFISPPNISLLSLGAAVAHTGTGTVTLTGRGLYVWAGSVPASWGELLGLVDRFENRLVQLVFEAPLLGGITYGTVDVADQYLAEAWYLFSASVPARVRFFIAPGAVVNFQQLS